MAPMRWWPAGELPPQRQILILAELLNGNFDKEAGFKEICAAEELHTIPRTPSEKISMDPKEDTIDMYLHDERRISMALNDNNIDNNIDTPKVEFTDDKKISMTPRCPTPTSTTPVKDNLRDDNDHEDKIGMTSKHKDDTTDMNPHDQRTISMAPDHEQMEMNAEKISMTLNLPDDIDHGYKMKRYRFRKTQQCAEMQRTMRIVNALTAEKEMAMLDSGYQLLPHDLATRSLHSAKSQIANPSQKDSVRRDCLDALDTALDVRIQQPELFTATNLEACSDVVGLYTDTEFDDYTCYVNERVQANENRLVIETDIRAIPSSPNLVVQGTMLPSCSAACIASTRLASSLIEATAHSHIPKIPH